MARQAAERKYENIDEVTGQGTLIVPVDDNRSTKVYNVASTPKSFVDLVNSVKNGELLAALHAIYIRGTEAQARSNFKSTHNTTVSLGGGRKLDLMEFAEKRGVKMTAQLINNRLNDLELMLAVAEDSKATAEEIEKQKAANRKREAGYFNAADALVASGQATMENGRLVVA